MLAASTHYLHTIVAVALLGSERRAQTHLIEIGLRGFAGFANPHTRRDLPELTRHMPYGENDDMSKKKKPHLMSILLSCHADTLLCMAPTENLQDYL